MKTTDITGIELEAREHGDWCLMGQTADARYHVWLNAETMEPERKYANGRFVQNVATVFKNPPSEEAKQRQWRTRYLSTDKGEGKIVWAALKSFLTPENIEAARKALDAVLDAEKQADQAQARKNRMEGMGGTLYDLLVRLHATDGLPPRMQAEWARLSKFVETGVLEPLNSNP